MSSTAMSVKANDGDCPKAQKSHGRHTIISRLAHSR